MYSSVQRPSIPALAPLPPLWNCRWRRCTSVHSGPWAAPPSPSTACCLGLFLGTELWISWALMSEVSHLAPISQSHIALHATPMAARTTRNVRIPNPPWPPSLTSLIVSVGTPFSPLPLVLGPPRSFASGACRRLHRASFYGSSLPPAAADATARGGLPTNSTSVPFFFFSFSLPLSRSCL